MDEEAADSAATAGVDSTHDIYDAKIVWNNKRKNADEDEADRQEADGQTQSRHAAAAEEEEEEEDEQYESDDNAPAPKAITAQQLKTLDPIVKKTQAAIKAQLQREEKNSKQTKQTAAAAQSSDRQTAKQTAQRKAVNKPIAKPQQTKRQKQEENEQTAEEEEVRQTRQPKQKAEAAQEEQAEEGEEDEHDADDNTDNNSVTTDSSTPHTRTRRTRLTSTGTPSAAELAERGVVYLGHLPHGFFEDQMRAFFSQFGEVTRVQLARNPKSGRSRHYGFVEFAHSSVATVVADAMHRYMMFGHTLVATVVSAEQRHPAMFEKDGMRFRVVPHRRMARVAHNAARSVDEQERRVGRLLRKDGKKRRQLAELGVEYEFPGYVSLITAHHASHIMHTSAAAAAT